MNDLISLEDDDTASGHLPFDINRQNLRYKTVLKNHVMTADIDMRRLLRLIKKFMISLLRGKERRSFGEMEKKLRTQFQHKRIRWTVEEEKDYKRL